MEGHHERGGHVGFQDRADQRGRLFPVGAQDRVLVWCDGRVAEVLGAVGLRDGLGREEAHDGGDAEVLAGQRRRQVLVAREVGEDGGDVAAGGAAADDEAAGGGVCAKGRCVLRGLVWRCLDRGRRGEIRRTLALERLPI